VLCHGEPEAEALRVMYAVPPERVLATGHGDYRMFVEAASSQQEARERLGLPPDIPLALFFGSLRTSKGLALLLDTWPAVHARVPDAHLLVAGRPLHGTSVEVAEADGVSFRFGLTTPAAANDFYAAADVVVMPYDQVTTSGVMRYAYSAGRPVVATTIGELGRHVIPGQTGWLVPPTDGPALGTAVVAALSDRARTAELGRRANAYGREHFDWQRIGAQTHAAMLRLIAR
jgi:glycosyltransferase involved in cell wall biosynthesis